MPPTEENGDPTEHPNDKQQKEAVNNITVDELAELYEEDPEKAKQKLLECFAAAFDAFNGIHGQDNVNEFIRNQQLMEDILGLIVEWTPRQNLVVMYLRWAKRQPKDHQTHSICVMQTLLTRFQQFFKNGMADIWASRNLRVLCCNQTTDQGYFYNSMFYETPKPTAAQKKNFTQFGLAMVRLSHQVAMFEKIAQSSTACGKIGRRNSSDIVGPTTSLRPIDELTESDPIEAEETSTEESEATDLVSFLTVNLLEFHKHGSLHNKFYTLLDARCLAHDIYRVLFKGKHNPALTTKSIEVTETSVHPVDHYQILAGICLMFPTLEHLDKSPEDRNSFFDNPNELRAQANNKALAQIALERSESHGHQIVQLIIKLNQHQSHDYNGLHAAKPPRTAEGEEPLLSNKSGYVRSRRWLLHLKGGTGDP